MQKRHRVQTFKFRTDTLYQPGSSAVGPVQYAVGLKGEVTTRRGSYSILHWDSLTDIQP